MSSSRSLGRPSALYCFKIYRSRPSPSPNFPETCLPPDSPGYGQISKPGTGKRRARRNPPAEMALESRHDWTIFSPGDPGPPTLAGPSGRTLVMSHTFASSGRHLDALGMHARNGQSDSPVMLHVPYVDAHQPLAHLSPTSSTSSGLHGLAGGARRLSPPLDSSAGSSLRYSPYPSPLSSTPASRYGLSASAPPPPHRPDSPRRAADSAAALGETIRLPPLQTPGRRAGDEPGAFHLPPISSMDHPRGAHAAEPMAVLRRLQSADDDNDADERAAGPSSGRRASLPPVDVLAQRRHSLAEPVPAHRP